MFEKTVATSPGSKESPLSETEHREKWTSCLTHYASPLMNMAVMETIAHDLYDKDYKWINTLALVSG